MRIRYRRAAKADLARIHAFIARKNPAAARRVIAEIRQQIREIGNFPEKHRPGFLEGMRELVDPKYGYIVVYALPGDLIDIVAVFHASEDHPSAPG